MYALLIFLDDYQSHAGRGDWVFEVGWLAFCTVGIAAAKSLSRPMSVNRTDLQEYSSLSE
jgi:hypothetical protein